MSCILGRRLATLLVPGVVLATLAAAGNVRGQTGETDLESLLNRAVQMHEAGDLEGAVHAYQDYLAARPDNFAVRSNLGAALARLGHYEEAIEQYQRALALEGRNPAIRFNLAVAYYKANRVPQAVTELTRVVSAQPDNSNAAILLGNCHLLMGEYKRAIALLTPLEAAHGDDPGLLYVLGTAFIRDNQIEKGEARVARLLRRGDSAKAHLMLGAARLMGRDYINAVTELGRTIELDPELPSAHSYYGRALAATGNRDRAIEAFRKELEINPNDYEANLYVGVMLKQEHKLDQASSYLEKARMLRPDAPDVRYQIGTLLLATGNLTEAQRVLEDLVKDEPGFIEAHVSLASVYYRLKRKADGDRMRAIVQKLNAEIQARAPGARGGLGTAYRGEGLPELHADQKPNP